MIWIIVYLLGSIISCMFYIGVIYYYFQERLKSEPYFNERDIKYAKEDAFCLIFCVITSWIALIIMLLLKRKYRRIRSYPFSLRISIK